ncbi:MAG: hypothetical protein DMG80_11650 [Acidobacteria bacterium]|nr:MAG: hypothetical protein DMG80_11650 [Acidobacteriota bacterium]
MLILKRIAGLASLTVLAFLIHGYHPYAEDAEIYLPGVLKILNPTLFPLNAEFFSQHAGNTLYPNLIAASVKLSHLSLPWVAFLWQIASIFLLLAATWRLAAVLFEEEEARWAAAALMATLLTLPVAGTALYIFDQYLNPRNLAAFAALFAVESVLRHKYGALALWLLFAAAVHPLMASFAIAFCIWLMVLDRYPLPFLGFGAVLPFGVTLDPPPRAYHEVALRQSYFYLLRWEWYEWIGLIAPIILFWLAARWARRREMRNLELVSRAMVPFILLAAVSALVLSIPARFEALARLEPLRCLALTYMLLIVIGAGLLSRLLRNRLQLSLVLLVPLGIGMYFEQRALFPASAHIEWPWARPRNPWAQAFEWIRANTPVDALFALNPDHMNLPGEDENGFRARAERSMLADMVKDKGAASMFPPLATQWWEQVQDAKNFQHLQKADFDRLRQKYGVSWVVVQQPGLAGIDCPYENSAVRVCRID